MRDRLTVLLEKADLALGSASGVIAEDALAPLIDSVRGVRTRLAYPEDVLVVALAGGTGSGKSSLFNAFCEEELVDVGGVRPTTSHPAAAVPAGVGSNMDGYLDQLGIGIRHVHDRTMVCLLDLPDTDSVELDHRYRVDALLPLVDVVVWVVDPEKYRDSRLHDEYLKPMAQYSDQFVFALNQVDRLSAGEAGEVRRDLEEALDEDSIDALVIPMSAAPPSGPPVGVDILDDALEQRRRDRATLYGKLLTDLASACHQLESTVGSGLDFDERASLALDEAARHLAAEDTARATDVLTGFLEELEAETGGVTAAKIEVITAEVPAHVQRISGDLVPERASGNWLQRLFGRAPESEVTADPREREARNLLSEAVVRPARAVLARRALAVASVAELAVEVESVRAATPG